MTGEDYDPDDDLAEDDDHQFAADTAEPDDVFDEDRPRDPLGELDEFLATWEQAYPLDVFGEATARQVQAGEASTDSFAATVARHVLARVRERVAELRECRDTR